MMVDITLEIDTELYNQVKVLCDQQGTTIEAITVRFLEACARREKWAIDLLKNGLENKEQ
ncbi:hypothetical protein LJC74_06565 [Eubacteriales bacterium OttesenSCG-928-A19]|nr:hypothetical protein [Eubacteriales bacterium OttesenSCG-928-A19]